ncbi:unnamed protein product [Auanema sp. JU1783]|nr:unnamed protein product [Auanema sp. JU1783]
MGQTIETYVFLDFETTGLIKSYSPRVYAIDQPDIYIRNFKSFIEKENVVYPRVTEIGMVAVERSDFELAFSKIGNKKIFESIPRSVFQRHVNHGLTEDELKKHLCGIKPAPEVSTFSEERCFGEEWPAITKFLDGLKKPLCFVAQNGLKFDYPILREELKRAGIDGAEALGDCFFADSLHAFQTIDRDYLKRIHEIMGSTNSTNDKNQLESDDPFCDLKINDWPLAIRARFRSLFIRKDNCDWSFNESSYKELKKFSQGKLYEAIFGETFDAHIAVNDCIALLRLCLAFNTVDYFDKASAQLFNL